MYSFGTLPQNQSLNPLHHGIKAKHRKAIRKRHVVAIILEILALTLLLYTFLQFFNVQNAAEEGLLQASQKAMALQDSTDAVAFVKSSLGFQFSYNRSAYALVARVTQSGKVQRFVDEQSDLERPYDEIDFSIKRSETVSQLRVRYTQTAPVVPQTGKQFTVTKMSEQKVTYAKNTFTYNVYRSTPVQKPKTPLMLSAIDTHMYTISLPAGSLSLSYDTPATAGFSGYSTLLNSLTIGKTLQLEQGSTASAETSGSGLFGLAKARAKDSALNRARLVATYTPAVVKIYHIYCGDVLYRGQSVATGCDGMAGSGFFISSNGLIATNGHVAVISPRDMLAHNLTDSVIRRLLEIDGYKAADISQMLTTFKSDPTVQFSLLSSLYKQAENTVTINNDQRFYMIALGEEKPDVDAVLKTRVFKETAQVKSAQFVASNYNSADNRATQGFKDSDVALLKVAGSNYPVVKLGGVDTLTQGAPMTILGFPSNADDNELTDNSTLQVTATSGVVGAMRVAKGGDYKLVQSDIQIGHGNSGGPAFDEDGNVFGVATYILAAQDSAETSISYIRDIADVKDLADTKNLTLNTTSDVQAKWEAALNEYYNGHFVKAKEGFREVGRLYPAHPLIDTFLRLASAKVAAGQEAKDPKVLISVVLGIIMTIAGIILTLLIIIRHYRKHRLYVTYHGGMHGVAA